MDEKHNFYLYDAAAKVAQLVKHPELRSLKEVQQIETCSVGEWGKKTWMQN